MTNTLLTRPAENDSSPVSNGETPAENYPVITVDRTLGRYFEHLDPDYAGISEFYDQLPHENKPPLSDLHIHYSATPVRQKVKGGSKAKYGTSAANGLQKQSETTPELSFKPDSHTIVVYVGTKLTAPRKGRPIDEDIAKKINETTAHELTHYAQRGAYKTQEVAATRRERAKHLLTRTALNAAISTVQAMRGALEDDTRWAKTGSTAAIGIEMASFGTPEKALLVGLVVAGITHASGIKARRQVKERETYLENPYEVDARNNEQTPIKLVNIELHPNIDTSELEDLTVKYPKVHDWGRRKANRAHRKLALQGRS